IALSFPGPSPDIPHSTSPRLHAEPFADSRGGANKECPY
ncbi:uncharacterized protein WCI35_008125, partial [Daubentonia madagascariensis]